MTVHFVYSKNTINSGDLACGYYRYFADKFQPYNVAIWDIGNIDFSKISKNDVVIIGGGGLLNNSDLWNYNINRLSQKSRYCFLFGVGFNAHKNGKIIIPLKLKYLRGLVIRDYQHPSQGKYVPCASCLLPELEKKYEIKRKYGVVKHFQHELSQELNLPMIMNDAPLDDILEFIGSSEIIITNTYHAVYWATLMRKKVILDAPFSEKFDYLRYPVVRFSGDLEKDEKSALVYDNALAETRELVYDYIEEILATCPPPSSSRKKRWTSLICNLVPVKKWRKILRCRWR